MSLLDFQKYIINNIEVTKELQTIDKDLKGSRNYYNFFKDLINKKYINENQTFEEVIDYIAQQPQAVFGDLGKFSFLNLLNNILFPIAILSLSPGTKTLVFNNVDIFDSYVKDKNSKLDVVFEIWKYDFSLGKLKHGESKLSLIKTYNYFQAKSLTAVNLGIIYHLYPEQNYLFDRGMNLMALDIPEPSESLNLSVYMVVAKLNKEITKHLKLINFETLKNYSISQARYIIPKNDFKILFDSIKTPVIQLKQFHFLENYNTLDKIWAMESYDTKSVKAKITSNFESVYPEGAYQGALKDFNTRAIYLALPEILGPKNNKSVLNFDESFQYLSCEKTFFLKSFMQRLTSKFITKESLEKQNEQFKTSKIKLFDEIIMSKFVKTIDPKKPWFAEFNNKILNVDYTYTTNNIRFAFFSEVDNNYDLGLFNTVSVAQIIDPEAVNLTTTLFTHKTEDLIDMLPSIINIEDFIPYDSINAKNLYIKIRAKAVEMISKITGDLDTKKFIEELCLFVKQEYNNAGKLYARNEATLNIYDFNKSGLSNIVPLNLLKFCLKNGLKETKNNFPLIKFVYPIANYLTELFLMRSDNSSYKKMPPVFYFHEVFNFGLMFETIVYLIAAGFKVNVVPLPNDSEVAYLGKIKLPGNINDIIFPRYWNFGQNFENLPTKIPDENLDSNQKYYETNVKFASCLLHQDILSLKKTWEKWKTYEKTEIPIIIGYNDPYFTLTINEYPLAKFSSGEYASSGEYFINSLMFSYELKDGAQND